MGIFQKVAVYSKKNILAGLSVVALLGVAACAPNPINSRDLISLEASGADSPAIFGGTNVEDVDPEVGSTVGIYHMLYGQVFCTGTLVAKNLVITAAHCTTDDPSMLAIYFDRKLGSSVKEARAKNLLRPVIAGKTHDQWAKNTFLDQKNWGDMALLRFDGPLPVGFKPVRILANRDVLQAEQMLNLVGFGFTQGQFATRAEGLNKAMVPISDPLFSEMEILMDQRDGKGACHGDSGGPAYVSVNGELVLVGVTSRGYADPKDSCEQYGIYTSPSTQLAWLQRAAAELQGADAVGARIPQPTGEEAVAKAVFIFPIR